MGRLVRSELLASALFSKGKRRVEFRYLVANEQGKDAEGKSLICLRLGKCFLLTMISIVLALYLARYQTAPFSKRLSLCTWTQLEPRNICFLYYSCAGHTLHRCSRFKNCASYLEEGLHVFQLSNRNI